MSDPRAGWTSASGAPADLLCPGRHAAQRGLQSEQSADAASGSAVHAALATGDTSKLSLRERETHDACKEIEAKLIAQFFGPGVEPKMFQHQRYWIDFYPGERLLKHSGEVDLCARLGERALVIDRKTLMGEYAESPRNLQLRDYAVLVRNEFVFIKEVGVAIVQPWVTRSPEICLYSEADLKLAEAQLFERVLASNDPQAKRFAGETQCKWCLAAKHGKCVEYQQWAGQVAPATMLHLLEVPVANWTPQQRSKAMDCVGAAQRLLDSITDAVHTGLQTDPAFCPGWRLKPGATRETIISPQTVYERFIALGGKHEKFMETIKVAKGELRLAINETTGARGAALDKAVEAICDGCVKSKQNAPSLERIKDNGQ